MDEEKKYLAETYGFLRKEIERETGALTRKRADMAENNREMWEEGGGVVKPQQFAGLVGYLAELRNSAAMAKISAERVRKYERMLNSPYFARVDFTEDDYDPEEIYIGYYNLMDDKAAKVYVYDWRAPISSVYYRFGLGEVFYESPDGKICGEVTLKRQYKIDGGELKFFTDVNSAIRDELLLLALSENSDTKMKTIVETIQKEQDVAIRDETSKVLIVSGVAGSGKTSVALHRAAYLLYEGNAKRRLTKNDVLIISPNPVFSEYIDDVLPSLGEESCSLSDAESVLKSVAGGANLQPRNEAQEKAAKEPNPNAKRLRAYVASWLKSARFAAIIRRYAEMYVKFYKFDDIKVDGQTIVSAAELKKMFKSDKTGIKPQSKLNRISRMVRERVEPKLALYREKMREKIYDDPKYRFEEEERLEKTMAAYTERVYAEADKTLKINVRAAYLKMFAAESNIPAVVSKAVLKAQSLPFDALAGLCYLEILLKGAPKQKTEPKCVIIDEGQDYGVLHYTLFSLLYGGARFTVLGDVNQTLSGKNPSALKNAAKILGEKDTKFLELKRSYRSSAEITAFADRILGIETLAEDVVERAGGKPDVKVFKSSAETERETIKAAEAYAESFGQVAIVTKTFAEAKALHKTAPETNLIGGGAADKGAKVKKGVNVLPVYAAKGLEFDAVIVYEANNKNYAENDERTLYVACTRALHKLSVYATEKLSDCFVIV